MPAGTTAALGAHAWVWGHTGHCWRPRWAIGLRASCGQAPLPCPAGPRSPGNALRARRLSSMLGPGSKATAARSSSCSKGRGAPGTTCWAPFLPAPQEGPLATTVLPSLLLSYQQLRLVASGSSALILPWPIQSPASCKEGPGGS